MSARHPAQLGPGRLVLVVGPSGAGKDTLIALAKAACADDPNIVFPRRVVTREGSASEDNQQLSPASFGQALERGEFVMHWQAHGHSYGLPRAVDDHIRAGRIVVVNVSRTVVDAMRRTYANVVVVAVTAPPEVLAERLANRGRSSDGDVALRLRRAGDELTAVPDLSIVNVGDAEEHAERLVRIIRGRERERELP